MAGGAQLGDGGDDEAVISEINVTPLVDIILVVLIIFMVTAHVIMGRNIPVKSPETVTGETTASTLALTMTPDGKVYVNGQEMTGRLPEVKTYIEGMVKAKPDLQAVITADRAVSHGDVMGMVDLVKQAGVKNLAFTTERKKAP